MVWGQVLGRISAVLRKYTEVEGKAWSLERIWEVLGGSWAGPGLLLGILVGSWEAFRLLLGRSWAVLGGLGRLFDALGQLLGALGRLVGALGGLLGALGLLWIVLGRQVGAKMEPKRCNIDTKTPQNRGQDGPR